MEQTRIINGLSMEDALKQYEPMVYRLVRAAKTNCVCNRDDLIQEGKMAIVRAFQSYDEGKGASLSTWIHRYVSGAILDYQKAHLSCLSGGSYLHQVLKELGDNATLEEMQKRKMRKNTIHAVTYIQQSYSTADYDSLEERADDDFSLDRYIPFVEWENYLTEAERDLVYRHYGFSGKRETIKDLAAEYGLSRNAITNRIQKALNKLRNIPGIEDYYYD